MDGEAVRHLEQLFVQGAQALGRDGGFDVRALGAVELAGGGRALVLDPGRYTYADDERGWRRWFKCTAAHNTVCVDG